MEITVIYSAISLVITIIISLAMATWCRRLMKQLCDSPDNPPKKESIFFVVVLVAIIFAGQNQHHFAPKHDVTNAKSRYSTSAPPVDLPGFQEVTVTTIPIKDFAADLKKSRADFVGDIQ